MYEVNTIEAPSFQENKNKELYMFLLLMQEHLLFLSFDKRAGKFVRLNHYTFQEPIVNINPDKLKSEIEELTTDSSKKILAINNSKCSLVPSTFMKQDIAQDVLKLNFNISAGEDCKWDQITKADSYLVYSRGKEYQKIAALFQPDISIHASTALLNALLAKTYYADSNDMFIDISEKFFSVFLIKNKKFLLFNSYPFKKEEDILYHLLNISEHFEFNTQKDNYHFSGLIDRNSALYELLFKYIRYPFFLRKPENYKYDSIFEEQSMHPYFKLFSLASCV
jgi:hypothetical protein